MINSAEEFIRLRTSDNPDEYLRAAWDASAGMARAYRQTC